MNATLLHGFQYVTNLSNLKILLTAKFFTSSTMKIKKYLVTKPQSAKNIATSYRESKALSHSLHVFSMCSAWMTAFTISHIYV